MKTTFAPWTEGERPEVVTECSPDGTVTVSLQCTADGLFVRRMVQRSGAARVMQAARFGTRAEFHRWCAADAARFNYPLLSDKVTRHGDDLFDMLAHAAHSG
ncbi:hypothetical protein [Ideonella sp. A 288]|uniref:hypothetical protein n=1 Tax=Ideonella sp. A 288 TaxID=1962181 RepID=UPI0011872BC1|nr:hypothetical protein [Ideonella sp. A 288]